MTSRLARNDGRRSSLAKSSSRFLSRRLRSLVCPSAGSELKSMLRKTFSSFALLASSMFSRATLISSPRLPHSLLSRGRSKLRPLRQDEALHAPDVGGSVASLLPVPLAIGLRRGRSRGPRCTSGTTSPGCSPYWPASTTPRDVSQAADAVWFTCCRVNWSVILRSSRSQLQAQGLCPFTEDATC